MLKMEKIVSYIMTSLIIKISYNFLNLYKIQRIYLKKLRWGIEESVYLLS